MSYKLLKLLELLKLIHHSRLVEINQWYLPMVDLFSFVSGLIADFQNFYSIQS